MTKVASGSVAGAEMMTFFTGPRMCWRASSALVKSPVDSTTMETPTEAQSSCPGSFTLKTLKHLPSTAMESSVCVTLFGRLPRIESYLSKCASVLESVMSFTATISIAGSPSAARKILRPMRPKPLMPTLTAMSPPENASGMRPARRVCRNANPDARARGEKSQRVSGQDDRSAPSVEFLDANHGIAREGDKRGVSRGISVDPVLCVFAFRAFLADFVLGTTHRGENHLLVHSHHGTMIFDGVLKLRRQRIDPIHRGRALFGKIEESGEVVF